jgi:hypothetical protein
MLDVLHFASGVNDDEEVVAAVGDHQIVKDAAAVVGEERVTLAING